jgi:hypothetical protein
MKQFIHLLAFLFSTSFAFAQAGELKGKVLDKNSQAVIDDASIAIYYGDSLYSTIIPDFGGNYSVINLPAGKITVVCTKDAYATLIEKNIPIYDGKTTTEDFHLRPTTKNNDIDLLEYKGAEEIKQEEVVKQSPAPIQTPAPVYVPPVAVQPVESSVKETITLLADSEVVKGSQKQGYFFKVGNSEPVRMKFFAGNLSPYLFRTPDAYAELRKYTGIKSAKLGLQLGFAGLVGIYAGSFFFDKNNQDFFKGYRIFLLGGAVACIGISAYLDEIKDKHLKRSVEIYNKSIAAH